MTQPAAIPRVLSIAGTDPTGGAGIHADLKSIGANGGYSMAVVTALVAQNTQGVRAIHIPPLPFLREQLDAVSDDVQIDAVKIGMLGNTGIIEVVSDWLAAHRPPVVVLDPVMVATSGDRLLDAAAESALRALLHTADLITPNMPELAVLANAAEADNWAAVLQQARQVAAQYQVHVLAKGGHLQGAHAPDALVTPAGTVTEFPGERIHTRNTHGTGCSYSAALATLRPQRAGWEDTVREAKNWLTDSIRHADALHVGHGNGPISHFATLWRMRDQQHR
ncbi:bifunctional hydroxymethylpyrimidine kinase/phosphomethylpyrimidine kinase [Corticibacter populi]|uniref:hydroxymethylpyrimidine kinase n=1 Tax=Corticibacter populi TaxID=1550736 RepID=A0A3M6R1E0_9BURK|nr:bifunctional hydroxymethylpyrimidine kinase/phosphomethylpyrimidine kinase [Corticibacter populi]RMX08719.1 bifunctional hydroxymethylpyrimidine kinase/phosphomethylpyrimidine kinase [Corticibacter populi]RZS36068.1 hydroxymethylpyrimidine kinase/phosphomethylpyrimidine kinase [Corticibacter populi]